MKIKTDRRFDKNFQKLPKKIQESCVERVKLFMGDRSNPLLRDHALRGSMVGKRAFSITGDYRVVYKVEGEYAIFMRVGKHARVYRKF